MRYIDLFANIYQSSHGGIFYPDEDLTDIDFIAPKNLLELFNSTSDYINYSVASPN